MKTVTVFVKRKGGLFHAATMEAEAHADSATTAARLCAARHFGTAEERIDLTPDGEHVLIAGVRPLAGAGQSRTLPWLIGIPLSLGLGLLAAWLLRAGAGGAR